MEDQHSGIYWFGITIRDSIKRLVLRHKIFFRILSWLLLILAFILRASYQVFFLGLRMLIPDFICAVAFAFGIGVLGKWLKQKRNWKRQLVWLVQLVIVLVIVWAVKNDFTVYNYFSLYFRYKTLDKVEINDLPLTGYERIQPVNSVRVLGNEAMMKVKHLADPDFVREKEGDYRFTMAIEPTFLLPRLGGTIDEIYNIPATTATANFSSQNRVKVKFAAGEHMLMGKNTLTATIKSFGLLRYFSYRPGDIRYIKDDQGEFVEVVSLTRFSGIFFLWPEFGGVQMIRQNDGGYWHAIVRLFFGEGKWIPPEKIKDYPFLVGQNIMPEEVSRYWANSFRFQEGIWAPFPLRHNGDIRIPDLPGDMNDQPFSSYAEVTTPKEDLFKKIWHYFALEPWNKNLQGLNTSVFIPADGIGPVYYYRHSIHGGNITGVSAIAGKVMNSEMKIDWNNNYPAEHLPWIHMVGGEVRFFWKTTVVTYKDKNHSTDFIAGSAPKVVLTDGILKTCVWVDSSNPKGWAQELEKNHALADAWGLPISTN